MARKQSPFEDLIDIAALLPWWVDVLLALVSYLVLNHFATAEVASPASMAQMGDVVASQFVRVFALFGQYLLPLVFLIGAGISAYKRHKRAGLIADVRQGASLSALNGMTWREFEMLVGEAFRREGYTVGETGGGGADGGVDLVLRKGGEKFLVQCKQWKAFKVGVATVRELYGVMAAEGAVGGFVVTSGVFTQEAKFFAEGISIVLIDGAELTAIIKKIRLQPQAATARPVRQNAPAAMPNCPKCGSAMVRRAARKGATPGKMFWGCPSYPRCNGTASITDAMGH